MQNEDFCFRRLTVTGCVSRLKTRVDADVCSLYFDLTVNRSSKPAKVLRACGEFWGPSLEIAKQVQDGSTVTATGCLDEIDHASVRKLRGFDLEQLLKVT